jgi:aminoglycoside phosphotransferase (APT) family kinase protein
LPRTEAAVRFLLAETLWVPQLGLGWDFPHPEFVAAGEPGEGYPWPWAVVTWLPGLTALEVPLLASEGAAVGKALAQVHVVAPEDAPFNDEQSIPLAARDAKTRERIARVAGLGGPALNGHRGERLDADAALALWEAGLEAEAGVASAGEVVGAVWSHADFHGANVLSVDGRFGGIVDWGSMAACDPAVDLGFMYTLMPGEGVEAALAAYGDATGRLDDALLARVRAVAVNKCVGVGLSDRPQPQAMAWRAFEALGVVK